MAPSELLEAGTKFLETWLVKRDVHKASGYISRQCTDCVKLNLSADDPLPKTPEEALAQLKKAMQRVIETSGTVKRLEEAVVAPQPNHADVKLVKHRNSRAFALVSIPEYMAAGMDCKDRSVGEAVTFQPPAGEKNWGKYYAIGLRLAKVGEDSGILWAVWAQERAVWKIVSYTVLNP